MSTDRRDEELANLLDTMRQEVTRSGFCDTVSVHQSHPDLADEALRLFQIERELETAVSDWKGREETDTIDAADTGISSATRPSRMSGEKSPALIGRYRIVRQLGRGGMGTVFAAEDPQLRRRVALKVPHFVGPPDKVAATRARFLREARAAARVEHANVCSIYDVGEHDQQPFVVMTFVEGESLADRLARQSRFDNPREAVELIAQVAEALAAVHAHGITHRDLKPGNILLRQRDGQAVLTDFGLAQVELDGEQLTNEGAMVGTPAYMAPEQANCEAGAVGPRSDLFSLGVVLFQMLTGRRPFEGTASQILGQLSIKDVPRVSTYRPDIDPNLDELVAKVTSRKQDERFPDATTFAVALRGWLGGDFTRIDDPTSPYLTRNQHSVRKRKITPFLIGLAVMAAVAVPLVLLVVHFAKNRSNSTTNLAVSVPTSSTTNNVPIAGNRPPLKGDITVTTWRKDHFEGPGYSLREAGVVPFAPGDGLRIEVRIKNRPAYIYIVWLDTEGKATPLYPWLDEDWSKRPEQETPLSELNLPSDDPLQAAKLTGGPPGIESLLLLARDEPLSANEDLRTVFAGLPTQKAFDVRAAAWFENGEVIRNERDRGPIKLGENVGIDDPVLRTQALLRTKLKEIFPFTRAVCFGNKGDK